MSPYYDDGTCVIWHTDLRDLSCLEPVAGAVTSPPYNSGVAYDGYDDSIPHADYQQLAEASCALIATALSATGGRAWINVGVSRLSTWLDAIRAAGMAERHIVCWDYGISTADTAWGSWQSPSAPHLRHAWEPVICATAGEWPRRPPTGLQAWQDRLGDWPSLTRGMWRIPPGASTNAEHPAVMPLALAERCIRLSTWPGEVVLDPFMGSGTTLLAAKRLGRRAVGVEQSERYCELAARRLGQGVLPLDEGAA
jgi:site-specific DNA-methyltransferase (adenine-specific)